MRRSIITFEERPNTRERNLQRASVHSCLGGGNPSDIYLWWILWISRCGMRRSSFALGPLLALSRGVGYFIFVWKA